LQLGTRDGRAARLRGRRSLEPVALSGRQRRALVVLALDLPVLVSPAARRVALSKQNDVRPGGC